MKVLSIQHRRGGAFCSPKSLRVPRPHSPTNSLAIFLCFFLSLCLCLCLCLCSSSLPSPFLSLPLSLFLFLSLCQSLSLSLLPVKTLLADDFQMLSAGVFVACSDHMCANTSACLVNCTCLDLRWEQSTTRALALYYIFTLPFYHKRDRNAFLS